MRIEKTNCSNVTSQIFEYIDRVTNKADDEKFRKNFDYILHLFTYMVEWDTISIDCSVEDIDFLLYDYIKTLAKNHHLAIYIFIDRGVEIETVNKLERLRKLCEFFKVTPTGLYDDKIQIHIGFFTSEFGERYDIDLIAKTLLD